MPLRGPGAGQSVTMPIAHPVVEVAAAVTVRKWFTTLRTVRTLFIGASGSTDVQNEELILVNNNRIGLKNGNIVTDSERVKQQVTLLGPDAITFTAANTWMSLTQSDLVRGSALVFDSTEAAIQLTEGTDFEIDYKGGRIKRVQGAGTAGSAAGTGAGVGTSIAGTAATLTVNQIVAVHYDYYAVYVKDTDYPIQYEAGFLARLSGGSVPNGGRVYVDYRLDTNITEAILREMIDQAHTYVMIHVAAALEGTQDDNLKYAETYFALSLLANASAADLLEGRRSDDVDQAARAMIRLSERYEGKAWEFLAPHLAGFTPRARAGTIRRNLSWLM